MSMYFDFVGSAPVAVLALFIHGMSVLLMLLILYQFIHIHKKRVDMLRELGDQNPTHFILERRILIITYVVISLIVILFPFSVYL